MKNSKKLFPVKYRCETAPNIISPKKHSHSKKEEFLFSQKSSLEILLGIIKNSQISFLSNISKKKNFQIKEK